MVTQADPRLSSFVTDHLPVLVRAFEPQRVIAFGSRVRGTALRHSDLDLIIVADSFADIPWVDRAVAVAASMGAPFGMDILCYTLEEFARKREELGIVRNAEAEGIDLLPIVST